MKILLTSEVRIDQLIQYCEENGHEIYVVKNSPNELVSHPSIQLQSKNDWGSIIEFIEAEEIDVTISVCGNTPEKIALIRDAMVKHYAEQILNKPVIGHPLLAAMSGVDKSVMRQTIRSNSDLTVADGGTSTNRIDAIQLADKIGYPVVLKDPMGSAGSKTSFCVTSKEIERYFEMYNPSRVLIEKHIAGIEVSIEALSYGGITVPLVPIYKGSTLTGGGHPTERLKIAPYHLSASRAAELNATIKRLGELFQWEGISDIDLIIPKQGPIVVLEVNNRFGGSTTLTNLTNASNTHHELVKMALNKWKPFSVQPKYLSLQVPVLQYFTHQQSKQLLDTFPTVKRVANKILPSRVKSLLTLSGTTKAVTSDMNKMMTQIPIKDAWEEFHQVIQSSKKYQELEG